MNLKQRTLRSLWEHVPNIWRPAAFLIVAGGLLTVLTIYSGWRPVNLPEWLILLGVVLAAAISISNSLLDLYDRLATRKTIDIPPAKNGEFLILIAQFTGTSDLDPQQYIYGRLHSDIAGISDPSINIRVERYGTAIVAPNDDAEAKRAHSLAEELDAVLVIWGRYDRHHAWAHYAINHPDTTYGPIQLTGRSTLPSQIDDFIFYLDTKLPQIFRYLSYFTIAQIYYAVRDWPRTHALLDRAQHCAPLEPEFSDSIAALRYMRAYVFHDEGKLPQAIEEYTEAIILKPDYATAYSNRGDICFALGDTNLALSDLNMALEIEPKYTFAYNNRGNVYASIGETEKAIEDYDTAIRLSPDLADPYYNRGVTRHGRGEFALAIQDFNSALRLRPNWVLALKGRALAHGNADKLELALEGFTESLALCPDDHETYWNRGLVHNKLHHWDQAIADFTMTLQIRSECAEAYEQRGIAYYSQDAFSSAIADLTRTIQLRPDRAETYLARGLAYQSNGGLGNAVQDYTKSIELSPKSAVAHAARGWAYHQMHDYDRAIADYLQGIELDPANSACAVNLACVYALTNRPQDALSWLSRALDISDAPARQEILADSDLDSLRDLPKFGALEAKYRPAPL